MEEILNKINAAYGICVSISEKVDKGFLSENYVISSGTQKFFLKKYRFDDSKRIREIHASKKYFADGGIPVILPIPLLTGETFFEFSNAYYAVFPFVNGRHIERGALTKSAIVSMGEMLGQIHLLGKNSQLVIDDHFKIEDKEKTFKKIEDILIQIEAKDPLDAFDKAALESVYMKKDLLLANTLRFESFNLQCDHLVHGDYLDHNVFFDQHDAVQYVFDFEKTNYSPRTYELFRSMIYGLLTAEVTETDLENAKTYLKAYSSVYPISKDEIRRGVQLFFVKAIHGFWVESEHYVKENTRVDGFLFDDQKRIKYLSENLDIFVDFLNS